MTRRIENIAVTSAIAVLGGAAFVLKAIEAGNAYISWRTKGKTLN
jgi:hypothetical protein